MSRRSYAKAAEEAAAAATKMKSVSYTKNFLSGSQRPWVTKDGSWTVKNQDLLKFHDFTKTGTSDELRAKPSNGVSEMGKTLVDAVVDLRGFYDSGLLGEGMNGLLAALEGKQAAFKVLNTFGSEVNRSHDHIKAATTDAVELLQKLVQKEQAQDLVVEIRQMAVRLAHLAQWLHSGMSAVADPEAC